MAFSNTVAPKPEVSLDVPGEDNARMARDRLLQKIRAEADLPALGSSVSRVIQLASSDDEAVRHLAHFILSDVALTQKILRVANTVNYRTASIAPVTTISKAIFLLGFETVRISALAMLLVDGMSGRHARSVRLELTQALAASIIGREIARRSHFKDAEEAAVAALFKNIGRLLVASHEPQLYARIAALVETGNHTSAQASMQVLGCRTEAVGESVLQEWKIPDTIIKATVAPAPVVMRPAKSRQEWLQQVTMFSATAAALISNGGEDIDAAAGKTLLARFGEALNLDQSRLGELLSTAAQEVRMLASHANLGQDTETDAGAFARDHLPEEQESAVQGLPDDLLLSTLDEEALYGGPRHASGKPVNARDLLLAGVQDVTQMMASGRCKLNDLLLLVLETLYSSMGFRFGAICLKDIQSAQFRARIAVGEQSGVRQAGFAFPCASAQDLFHLALENDADLMISDANVPKIRNLLPAWHKTLLPDARSFIVLPLVLNKKQIGLFYADRAEPAPEGVPPDETALIKTLKGQVLAALQPR